MVHSEFCNITTDTIGVEDGADHFDNLRHPVAEPSLYVAVDLGVKVLETLLASRVHAEPSFVAFFICPMQPACPPRVKPRLHDEERCAVDSEPGRSCQPSHPSDPSAMIHQPGRLQGHVTAAMSSSPELPGSAIT